MNGWENEGSWEYLHMISCIWKEDGTKNNVMVYDAWAKVVCKATNMYMLEYFAFWNF